MRNLKSELEVKEAKHFKRKAGDVFEGECDAALTDSYVNAGQCAYG